MKFAISISLILHLTVLWIAPWSGEKAPPAAKSGPAITYLGALGARIPAARFEETPGSKEPEYSRFRTPETEAGIIDPPAVSYEAEWSPPAPALTAGEIKALSDDAARRPGGIDILADSLKDYKLETIPFEEKLLP